MTRYPIYHLGLAAPTVLDKLLDLPRGLVVAILVVLVVQVVLQVAGLIDLYRRPRVLGARKWVWAVIIVAGNLVGAVVYWAIARSPDVVTGGPSGPRPAESHRKVIDQLYGKREGE